MFRIFSNESLFCINGKECVKTAEREITNGSEIKISMFRQKSIEGMLAFVAGVQPQIKRTDHQFIV